MNVKPIPTDIQQLLEYRGNPYKWACENVKTLDSVDKFHPIKAFPSHEPYLEYYFSCLSEQALFATVKHRRMFITWANLIFCTHEASFFEGVRTAIISKKEEDADELVQRCSFIMDNLPKTLVRPTHKYVYGELRFPEIDSKIFAVAQGPDQLRQFTCTRIFGDEVMTWPQARATFVAMKPTLEGGGHVSLVSTRYPGFFKELIEDTFDAAA